MNQNQNNNIKHLSHDAARLLLVFLSCEGAERLTDLPLLMKRAGISSSKQYARAYKQLFDLGFIAYRHGSICIL